jgi:hypothetical protein
MDDFTWQVTRNTLWKVSRELEEMDDVLLSEILSPLISGLADTIDRAPEYIDSNAANWQALEDELWSVVWNNTRK